MEDEQEVRKDAAVEAAEEVEEDAEILEFEGFTSEDFDLGFSLPDFFVMGGIE